MEERKFLRNAGGHQQVIAIQGYHRPTVQELLGESNGSDWMNGGGDNGGNRLSEGGEREERKGMAQKKNEKPSSANRVEMIQRQ